MPLCWVTYQEIEWQKKKKRENGCHLGACNVRQVGSTDKGMRQS